jgi:hypothetical protein
VRINPLFISGVGLFHRFEAQNEIAHVRVRRRKILQTSQAKDQARVSFRKSHFSGSDLEFCF